MVDNVVVVRTVLVLVELVDFVGTPVIVVLVLVLVLDVNKVVVVVVVGEGGQGTVTVVRAVVSCVLIVSLFVKVKV